MITPRPPEGSNIKVEKSTAGIEMSWKNPGSGVIQYGMALFMLFWLGGWAMGEIFAIKQVFFGKRGAHDLFLIFWLGAWSIAGLFAVLTIFKMLQPPKPEKLIISQSQLSHFPGTEPVNAFSYSTEENPFRNPFMLLTKPKVTQVSRQSISNIQVNSQGNRQRLTFDIGADRIEIGKHLKEPEREWLAKILTEWNES